MKEKCLQKVKLMELCLRGKKCLQIFFTKTQINDDPGQGFHQTELRKKAGLSNRTTTITLQYYNLPWHKERPGKI